MNHHMGADTGCLYVGEYIDEGEVLESPSDLEAQSTSEGQVQRPRIVAEYVDVWSNGDSEREFKVLLRDRRIATVRGHFVQFVPNPGSAGDAGSYGIVRRTGQIDAFVALFNVADVEGVFNGEIASPPSAA